MASSISTASTPPAPTYSSITAKFYDSKAIVGVAHGHLPGRRPLTPGEFSGGEATVGRLLRKLGFTVQVGNDLTPERLERILARLQVYRLAPAGDGSAADSPAVRPVRPASSRTSTSRACDTTPVPPPDTSRPRDHPVAFT
jgi:hypothetical protein